MIPTETLAEIDAIFDRFHAAERAPGCAFGVVMDGALVHTGGRGTLRVGEDAPPDADSRFRIASMTKSFTAATVLRLRDDGVLRLDDEVVRWVPELAAVERWSRDSPPITIRSLLTMAAGLPTDDPWGDRQQDLAAEAFLGFLGGGLSLVWPPATRFEYANLGYAILGLVIERATGEPYRDVVERRILGPLRLTSTAFEPDDGEAARLALGYVRRDGAWVEQAMAGHGAFAPMGGLFTTVRDLATWVAWLADAFPARDDPDDGDPLSRASRREMQQVQQTIDPELAWTSAAAPPEAHVFGYGFGLFLSLDVARGRIVGHGGGYPGYGSHMRWHPASGIALVGVANGRYAGMFEPCRDALNLLVDQSSTPVRRPAPWPATVAARASVNGLLAAWDDDVAAGLFAMNVELDEDLPARRAAIDELHRVHGRLRPDESEPDVSWSSAHLEWWLAGERGRVKVEILLNGERPPRVQLLDLTSVPEPPPALTTLAQRIAGLVEPGACVLPPDLELGDGVDRAQAERELRATEAIFGPVTLGSVTAGDGERQASWILRGRAGDVTLTLERDPSSGLIETISLVPVTRETPIHLA